MHEYRPNNISIRKMTRMRSPFIDNLIPSKELTLEQITRAQTKRKYQKSNEPTSVTCNSLMYTKNRYDMIDEMKKNINNRLKTSNTHKKRINQT